jgi:hypothetical protein
MSNQADNETRTSGVAREAPETNYANKISFLNKRLQYHIDDYLKKRNQSRWLANAYKGSVVVLGALITILLGVKAYVKADQYEYVTMLALVFSTAVTAMTSWETFADYRGKWIRERSVLVILYDIRDDLSYALAGSKQLSDEETDKFYDRLRLALSLVNEQWMTVRAKAIDGGARPPADNPH